MTIIIQMVKGQTRHGGQFNLCAQQTSLVKERQLKPATPKEVCLVIGAGDGVGGAIAKAFAADGMAVCVTRRARNLDQLEALAEAIRSTGGEAHAFGIDARSEQETIDLFAAIERDIGPISVVVFNIGANVQFGIRETTTRVFTKVWEMACLAGFLAGREAANVMVPRAIQQVRIVLPLIGSDIEVLKVMLLPPASTLPLDTITCVDMLSIHVPT